MYTASLDDGKGHSELTLVYIDIKFDQTGDSLDLRANLSKPLIAILVGFLSTFLAIVPICDYTSAQHHGAPPPLATLGDRNIVMNFTIEPKNLIAGQDAQLIMHLTDQNSDEKIQHVTYRIAITNQNNTKMSEFFHSHAGELVILAKSNGYSHIVVGGTFDVLTNALVPDPSGKIIINGPLFSEPGIYYIDIEITTVDNDKTDLQTPLTYHFVTNNSNMSIS
ncbi:hypothetical protein NMY3_02843 [Candidatus Nitrosocosmicus oleophilus]|uniref:Uncharacterized protein n=1 Tax=Candidatus Nitrosocosmicus oleophilus TaxID=1353260 RepID=A0A654MC37_9ARCH|nr:hypothetical protein [Candidatus Nitrosocosmicus oleophilus]ALI37032.1 hypothetical protein NMY3_02843 [Candidatus Nitrosocosmicus oleophilus]